jgi:hypothetical protein
MAWREVNAILPNELFGSVQFISYVNYADNITNKLHYKLYLGICYI